LLHFLDDFVCLLTRVSRQCFAVVLNKRKLILPQ